MTRRHPRLAAAVGAPHHFGPAAGARSRAAGGDRRAATSSTWRWPTIPRRCPMPRARSPRRASATRTSRCRSTRPRKRTTHAFAEALEAADGPVHVHCIMNWRVSAFFYRYHRDACGMPEAEARALMERQWSPETNDHPDAPDVGRVHRGAGALMDFHGQHIVVTGGSSGIGLVTAQLLASRGARVSLIARRQELLDEAVAGIGEHAAGFAADVGDKAAARRRARCGRGAVRADPRPVRQRRADRRLHPGGGVRSATCSSRPSGST